MQLIESLYVKLPGDGNRPKLRTCNKTAKNIVKIK